MLYVIIARDIPASQERRPVSRPAHLVRLEQLKEEGRLVPAGPHPAIDGNDPGAAGFTGSPIVTELDSPAVARSWVEADPYRAAGVYAEVVVKPLKKVLPWGSRRAPAAGPVALPTNVFTLDAAFRCPPQRN